ncbi:MAG: glycosyltransferase [Gemmatimonadaceae bacterium]|jgi:cellulose synthase/poly-beta-1,6-N-acetylglucosamine synthase-like glycosyltransferase|nr:glycosyltransferase [Gemmatimonadaceae bacterium]
MIAAALVAGLILGFTWAGYPLLMRLLSARTKPRQKVTSVANPAVAVLIASRETPAAIANRVADVRAGSWPESRLRVVVALDVGGVAGGPESAEATRLVTAVREAVAAKAEVVAGDAPGGKASALNAGMRVIHESIVVMTDTHQRFAPDAIERLVAALEHDPRLGAVSGALSTRADGASPTVADLYWSMERRLREDEASIHSTVGVTGAVYAIRRERMPRLPAGLILDDLYVPMSVVLGGARVGFAGDARATDQRRFSTDQEYRRKVRTLTGVWQLCAWLPAVLLPGRNPIWLQFVAHKLLRLLTPLLTLVLVVAVAVVGVPAVHSVQPWALPAAGVAAAALLLAPGIGRKVRNLLHSLLAMQAAIVVASINGIRGRWTVWR